ncbi:hypothetical protein AB833_09345 [Chromatiales bacterium (ex Bugula neritina AB1)]|nr:hypothetical protein AB833_09345 [Chromatiales bacterium (ex Bugula neritina AB1)]
MKTGLKISAIKTDPLLIYPVFHALFYRCSCRNLTVGPLNTKVVFYPDFAIDKQNGEPYLWQTPV